MACLSLYQTFQRAVADNNTIQAYRRLLGASKMMMSLWLIASGSKITYQRKPHVEIFDFLSDLRAPQDKAYVNYDKVVPVIKVAAIAPFIRDTRGS